MYRLDTNQARTDLYGIGKGSAQVIDNTPLREAVQQSNSQRFAEHQAKQKEQNQRLNVLSGQMENLNKVAIFDRDKPKFAQMQGDLYDTVYKNIDKIRDGDSGALLQVQKQLGNIYTEAELSKNTREQAEKVGQTILEKGTGVYRSEDLDKFHQFITGGDKGEFVGDYDTSKMLPKQNIDYNKRVTGELSTYAQRMAQDTPYSKTFNRKQADDLIANDLTDPVLFEQAHYDFNKAPKEELKKLGNPETPIEYYQQKYAPSLLVKDIKDPALGEKWDSSHVINATYQPSENGKVFTIQANSQKPTTIDINGKKQTVLLGKVEQDKAGKIVGKATVQLTPDQLKENQSVKNEAYQKDLNAYDQKTIGLTDPDEKAKIPKPIKDDAKYRDIPVPNKDTKTLDYTQTSQILKNTYGIDNIYETFNKDKSPAAHVNMKTTDTRNQVKQETGKSKPVFTKQELEDKAAQAGYSYHDYYELVKDKIILK